MGGGRIAYSCKMNLKRNKSPKNLGMYPSVIMSAYRFIAQIDLCKVIENKTQVGKDIICRPTRLFCEN